MQYLLSILPFALAALAVAPESSPVPDTPAPGSPPPGCSPSYATGFTILNTKLPGASRKRTPPSEGPASGLYLTLADGILKDSDGRFGYIAANHQFQFDNPIQAGSIYTENWSACPNNTLALGSETTFYQCLSGNFYNLYNSPVGAGCIPIEFAIISTGAAAPAAGSSAAPTYAASSASVASSTPAPASTPAPSSAAPSSTPAPVTTAAPVSSAAPAATSAAPASYTGAANPLAIEGSFFAVAAGAAVLAAF